MTSNSMQIGCSRVDITPPVGIELAGFAGVRKSTGVQYPLYAKAVTLKKGRSKIQIISLDLIGLTMPVADSLRRAIEKQTGIPKDNILITTVHTHSGPNTVEKLVSCGRYEPSYMRKLKKLILQASRESNHSFTPCTMKLGSADVTLAVNRRLEDDTGTIKLAPDSYGIKDKKLGVSAFYTREDAPRALFFNYSSHAVVLGPSNLLISPDFPGNTAKMVEDEFGGAVCLPLIGYSGNINPVMRDNGDQYEQLAEMSRRLSAAIVKTARNPRAVSCDDFKVVTSKVFLPFRQKYSIPELEKKAKGYKAKLREVENGEYGWKCFYQTKLDWHKSLINKLKKNEKLASGMYMTLQALKLGEVVILAMPGEVFVEYGLYARKVFQSLEVYPVSGANGNVGYIPTSQAIVEGGYEVEDAPQFYSSLPFALPVEPRIKKAIDNIRASISL